MASEYLKWKYRDVKPDEPLKLTGKQKMLNWWRYHRLWLLVGALLLLAAADILRGALGLGAVKPDAQIAYVAAAPLSEEAKSALEAAFSGLGDDFNGDGRVLMRVNAYVSPSTEQDADAARYTAASQVRLMADMEACDSYFFLCDDYETFHTNYQILSDPAGSLAEGDEPVQAIPLAQVPALADLAEQYPELKGLSLCRRGFWQDRVCPWREECDALWARLAPR